MYELEDLSVDLPKGTHEVHEGISLGQRSSKKHALHAQSRDVQFHKPRI